MTAQSPELDPEAELLKAERAYLAKIRPDGFSAECAWALAHSGGGIRSAAFALGMQHGLLRLSRDRLDWMGTAESSGRNLLSRFDYLSTVSGGGYTGTALTWHLGHMNPKDDPLSAANYPLSGRGRRIDGSQSEDLPAKPKSLDWIRQNASYLNAKPGHSLLTLAGTVMRGMLHAGLFHFLLALFAIGVAIPTVFAVTGDWAITWSPGNFDFLEAALDRYWVGTWLSLAGVVAVGGLLGALAYAVATRAFAIRPGPGSSRDALALAWARDWTGRKAGFLLGAFLACLYLAAIGLAADALRDLGSTAWGSAGGLGVAIGVALTIWRTAIERGQGGVFGSGRSGLIASIAALIVASLFLVGAYAASAALLYGAAYFQPGCLKSPSQPNIVYLLLWAFAALSAAMVVGFFCNINLTSPHRMYRDALVRTFLRDLRRDKKVEPEKSPEVAALKDACSGGANEKYGGPYHLICANVALAASETQPYRDRSGDSWLFSPLFVGSDATGWRKTPDNFSLGTAMAISGAAANPYTGGAGKGLTRDLPSALLMSLFNLRLGFAYRNPARGAHDRRQPPNLLRPGLENLFGKGQHEDAKHVELSDGGHFDNTGLYELFRRKVRVIFLTDAGCDPDYKFDDLSNALVRARVDFGVNVDFDDEFDPTNLAFRRDKDGAYRPQATGNTFAFGIVEYDDGTRGLLVIFKPTLVENMPLDLDGYARQNAAFPHDSTADQFFDETQFEAYRELGYQLVKRAFKEPRQRAALLKAWPELENFI